MKFTPENSGVRPLIGKWDDLVVSASQLTGAPALAFKAIPTLSLTRGYCFTYDVDESLYYTQEMGHEWDFGEVHLHCHVVPIVDPAGPKVLRMRYSYAWIDGGVVSAEASATVSKAIDTPDTLKRVDVALATIAPPSAPTSATFLAYSVTRVGASDAADTYHATDGGSKANLWILGSGLHYKRQRFGTDTEFA